MKRSKYLRHLWLVFGAYGVWFAIFSGIEEMSTGKLWKVTLSLALALVIYFVTEAKRQT